MRILHVNIRASQGGAGRVALDLHRRLRLEGVDSRLVYGYGSGIKDDSQVVGDPNIQRIGTRPTVLGNYASHRLAGIDLFTGNKPILAEAVRQADVVHLHCPHHYFMNWRHFVDLIARTGKPLVATAHDWWFVTGRCGFIEDCTGWQRQCGECGPMKERDLPSYLDFSRHHRDRKVGSIRRMGAGMRFACPSEHLARDYRRVYPDTAIHMVPNCVDLEFEAALNAAGDVPAERSGYLFSASDLASPGKIDAELVHTLMAGGDVKLRLVGRNNPFGGDAQTALGEVRDRARMVDILRSSRALVFCSRMDNAPLTIMEALVTGCFVLAYQSAAAEEMLKLVGGRCVPDRETMLDIIRSGGVESLYEGIDTAELMRRARAHFSGAAMTANYRALYEAAIAANLRSAVS